MERINIAELLKDCPKGMELDCTMYDDITLVGVDDPKNTLFPIKVLRSDGCKIHLTEYGQYADADFAKCVIYPKGKTTWEGFVPPYKFKDGDIVATTNGLWIGITTGGKSGESIPTYCVTTGTGGFEAYFNYREKWKFQRLATEEEKTKLFDAIKENGYKWNPENKTLEKLPKFKEGDVAISDLGDIHLLRTENSSYCAYRIRWTGLSKLDNTITTGVKVVRLATEEEKQILFDSIKANGYRWNEETKSLEKLINKNKFVIGAIVTNGKIKGKICLRDGDSYVLEDGTHIFFNEVHNWELVPTKFDVTTLKPFDKVLVRDNNEQFWTCDWFSFHDTKQVYPFACVGHYVSQCIPYEGNQHLLGTTNDCDKFYKNWE